MASLEKKKTSITEAQAELHVLAADAGRLWSRVRGLGEELDAPQSEAQDANLEPELLAVHVSSWLLTSGDVSIADLAERLAKLARLNQDDLEQTWRTQFPVVLVEETSSRLDELDKAAETVLAAAAGEDVRQLTAATEIFCRRLEHDLRSWQDLATPRLYRRTVCVRRQTPNPEPRSSRRGASQAALAVFDR